MLLRRLATHLKPLVNRRSAARFRTVPIVQNTMETSQELEQDLIVHTLMCESFGVEYATRSDEDGFGVIYASKPSLRQPPKKEITGDVMYESFGVEYATRSDEEGFGVIYGSKPPLSKEEDEEKLTEK